jgi:UDP-N-acetyl-D-glucosamine dehydrogenase
MSVENPKTLAIIGQGYVGLPLAMAAVDAGWSVIGIDNFEDRVNQINSGISPVEDISNTQLKSSIKTGAYVATTDFSMVAQAEVITICVPTPLNDKREPDLSMLQKAATSIAPFLSNEALVVSESTSYPGTLREIIIPTVNALKSLDTTNIYFASAPERVNPGDQIWNQKNTPRLIGGIDEASQAKALTFYRSICDAAVPVSTPEIAEAAKLLENTFRLVNIALVNEFAQICSSYGINVHDVIDAASTKPYGYMSFQPGVGVGGHCIPVDPLYLTWWARQVGTGAPFIETADSINLEMPLYVGKRALALAGEGLHKPRVLILGVAYKPGVSDVRETPVSSLAHYLKALGAEVAWHDPFVKFWEESIPVEIDWECDVAILATAQPGMDISKLIRRGSKILDCTNTLQPSEFVTYL